MSPKEALIRDGFPGVKPGRGRLSREAIARCKELAASGVQIDGYVVSQSTAPVKTAEPVEVKKVAVVNEKVIVDVRPERYNPKHFKAVSKTPVFGVTEFGMATVCGCGESLSYHRCDNPTVFGGIPVVIKPRA